MSSHATEQPGAKQSSSCWVTGAGGAHLAPDGGRDGRRVWVGRWFPDGVAHTDMKRSALSRYLPRFVARVRRGVVAGLVSGAVLAEAASPSDGLQGLLLEGTLTKHRNYVPEGTANLEITDFTVTLTQGGWSIQERPQAPLRRVETNIFTGGTDTRTTVWDGAELVDWTLLKSDLIRLSRNPNQAPQSATIFGRDDIPPNVPDGWDDSLRLLWLAFASGEVLDGAAPGRLPAVWPVAGLRSDPPGRPARDIATRRAAWGRFPESPGFLKHAVFTAERPARSKTRAGLGEPTIYTNGVYEVTTTTNLGGWIIPTEVLARRFEWRPVARFVDKTMDMVLSNLANITIEVRQARRIDAVRPSDLRPRVPGRTVFTDFRFTGRPFSYAETNWLAADSPRFRAMKAAVIATKRSIWLKRFSGMLALIGMGGVSLGFFFFLSRKRQKGIRRTTSEHPRTNRNL